MPLNGHSSSTETLTPDYTEAERHLTLLDEEAERFTFQTFTDAPRGQKPKPDPLAKVLNGRLEEHWQELVDQNLAGAGIFVTVQATDGHGRKLANVTDIRAFFREVDRPDAPALPAALQPHLVVATSPGHHHDYILTDGAPLDVFEGVQQRLVDDYGSDPDAKDRARVLRLAGFYHQKDRANPFRVRIIHESGEAPYSWAEVSKHLPPAAVRTRQAALPAAGTPIDPSVRDMLESALLALDPDMGYADWLRVGMALHSTGGTLEAFRFWDDWSSGALHAAAGRTVPASGYRPGECAYKWGTFGQRHGGPEVTADTVRWMALQAGWRVWEWAFADVPLNATVSRQEAEQDADAAVYEALAQLKGQTPIQIDRAMTQLSQQYKIKKAALIAEYKRIMTEDVGATGDPGMTAATEALRRHYDSGQTVLWHPSRTFWIYNGQLWQRIHPESIKERAVAVITDEPSRYVTYDSQGVPRPPDVDRVAGKAVELIKATQNRDQDPFGLLQEPPPVICCANGELWLPEKELRQHRADSFLITGINILYNPAAECPTFLQVMGEIMSGDKALVRHMQEQLGYIIWPQKWLTTFQLWTGEGANGKTLLAWVIQQLLGDAAVVTKIQELDGKFEKEHLPGKQALIDDDVDHTTPLPIAEIKKLAEKKVIDTAVKYGGRLRFIANLALVLLANDWPVIRDTSYGYLRRANVTPFGRTFTPQRDALNLARAKGHETLEAAMAAKAFGDNFHLADEGLKGKLTEELPGILKLLIASAERLRERGGWDEPPACVEARDEWLRSHDSVARYVREGCEPDGKQSVPLETFKQRYASWCVNTQSQQCGQREVTKRLGRLGFAVSPTHGRQYVRGLRILDPEIQEPVIASPTDPISASNAPPIMPWETP